jgi:hypothetical protein
MPIFALPSQSVGIRVCEDAQCQKVSIVSADIALQAINTLVGSGSAGSIIKLCDYVNNKGENNCESDHIGLWHISTLPPFIPFYAKVYSFEFDSVKDKSKYFTINGGALGVNANCTRANIDFLVQDNQIILDLSNYCNHLGIGNLILSLKISIREINPKEQSAIADYVFSLAGTGLGRTTGQVKLIFGQFDWINTVSILDSNRIDVFEEKPSSIISASSSQDLKDAVAKFDAEKLAQERELALKEAMARLESENLAKARVVASREAAIKLEVEKLLNTRIALAEDVRGSPSASLNSNIIAIERKKENQKIINIKNSVKNFRLVEISSCLDNESGDFGYDQGVPTNGTRQMCFSGWSQVVDDSIKWDFNQLNFSTPISELMASNKFKCKWTKSRIKVETSTGMIAMPLDCLIDGWHSLQLVVVGSFASKKLVISSISASACASRNYIDPSSDIYIQISKKYKDNSSSFLVDAKKSQKFNPIKDPNSTSDEIPVGAILGLKITYDNMDLIQLLPISNKNCPNTNGLRIFINNEYKQEYLNLEFKMTQDKIQDSKSPKLTF